MTSNPDFCSMGSQRPLMTAMVAVHSVESLSQVA
jgi:hypothetical protein